MIREIISTEASYVNNLLLVKNHYIDLFQKKPELRKKFPQDYVATVELILGIVGMHQQFLAELKKINLDDFDHIKVSELFLLYGHFFKSYAAYVSQYERMITQHAKLQASDKEVSMLFSDVEKHLQGLTLGSYLIMPVQRMPRYKLLLAELLKKIPEDHADYQQLKVAHQLIGSVALSINEGTRYNERGVSLVIARRRLSRFRKRRQGALDLLETIASVSEADLMHAGITQAEIDRLLNTRAIKYDFCVPKKMQKDMSEATQDTLAKRLLGLIKLQKVLDLSDDDFSGFASCIKQFKFNSDYNQKLILERAQAYLDAQKRSSQDKRKVTSIYQALSLVDPKPPAKVVQVRPKKAMAVGLRCASNTVVAERLSLTKRKAKDEARVLTTLKHPKSSKKIDKTIRDLGLEVTGAFKPLDTTFQLDSRKDTSLRRKRKSPSNSVSCSEVMLPKKRQRSAVSQTQSDSAPRQVSKRMKLLQQELPDASVGLAMTQPAREKLSSRNLKSTRREKVVTLLAKKASQANSLLDIFNSGSLKSHKILNQGCIEPTGSGTENYYYYNDLLDNTIKVNEPKNPGEVKFKGSDKVVSSGGGQDTMTVAVISFLATNCKNYGAVIESDAPAIGLNGKPLVLEIFDLQDGSYDPVYAQQLAKVAQSFNLKVSLPGIGLVGPLHSDESLDCRQGVS